MCSLKYGFQVRKSSVAKTFVFEKAVVSLKEQEKLATLFFYPSNYHIVKSLLLDISSDSPLGAAIGGFAGMLVLSVVVIVIVLAVKYWNTRFLYLIVIIFSGIFSWSYLEPEDFTNYIQFLIMWFITSAIAIWLLKYTLEEVIQKRGN